jgi:CubicO group peptidase (beta-lactamase class C family)
VFRIIYIILLLTILLSCSENQEEKEYTVSEVPPLPQALDLYSAEIDSIFLQLSTREKLEQLFWISLNLEKPLDKNTSFPSVAFIENNGFMSNRNFIELDSLKLEPHIFSRNLFDVFENSDAQQTFKPHHLLSITDTVFLNNFYKVIYNYGLENRISCYIPNKIQMIDSNYQKYWNIQENILLDSLYQNHFILGNHNDSIQVNSIIASKNIRVLMDGDSITELPNSICQLNIKTLKGIESTLDKEFFIEKILLGNFDAGYFSINNLLQIEQLNTLLNEIENGGLINNELLEYKVRKVVALKKWALKKPKVKKINSFQLDILKKGLHYQSVYQSISMIKNDKSTVPLVDFPKKNWQYVNIGKNSSKLFRENISLYANITEIKTNIGQFNVGNIKQTPTIILLNNQLLDSIQAIKFSKDIISHHKNYPTIVVNCGNASNLNKLKDIPVLIQLWDTDETQLAMVAQAILGGNPVNGKVFTDTIQTKILKTPKTRLSYTIPEEIGISSDSLKNMDKVAAQAIWGGATPGCQVFAAKEGKVFYNKSFGYHTYLQKQKVTENSVYDIASVTKVASTTLCGMHMYDKGYYNLNDSLKNHLPDSLYKTLGHYSRLYNVTFQKLFTHTSGLPAGLPIYKMIAYTNKETGRFDKYYCDEKDQCYKVEVAKDFFLDSSYLDSLWIDMNNIWTGEKKYKYSDANMNVLYQIFRSKLNKTQKFEKYMDSVFYAPLNLEKTCYLPLKHLDTLKFPIVPTENDKFWRKQLVKGHVHDPNAAIYGGVAGNAGLFSTAHDLGIIMQMLMNGGTYGGKRYLKETTVKKFSSHQEGSHRGLGFDKPTESSGNVVAPDAPYTTYGHTGFTGICVWNDTENDIVFTFVSNRVHPSAENKKLITMGIRKRLHQVIYDQLHYNGTYKNKQRNNVPVMREKPI